MKTSFPLVFSCIILLLSLGCAHKYSEAEYRTVADELNVCRQDLKLSGESNTELSEELSRTQKELEEARAAIDSFSAEKQDLLDRNIQCLEEKKALMKQISQSNAGLQEQKEAQWRMSKGYEYVVSFLETERIRDLVYIIRTQDRIKIVLPQHALFPTVSSAWLTPRGTKLVEKIASGLKQLNPAAIEIAGHTDNTAVSGAAGGAYPTNWHLAQARAMSVLMVFLDSGIPREKVCTLSFGETRPIADNQSEEGRAMNRRVEIFVTP